MKRNKPNNTSNDNGKETTSRGEGHKNVYIESMLTDTRPQSPDSKVNNVPSKPSWRKGVDKFFLNEVFHDDYNGPDKHFCILASAGMGKTTALNHLYAQYTDTPATILDVNGRPINKPQRSYDIQYILLSEGNTIDAINKVQNKNRCILLLDALDECPEAQDINTYPAFRQQLVKACAPFARVVITCRPAFFDNGRQRLGETDTKSNGYGITYKELYLDYFSDDQVRQYLNRAYPELKNKETRDKAERIIQACHDITMRPLMLSYIDYLVEENKDYRTTREIYDVIFKRSIDREVSKAVNLNREEQKEMWKEIFFMAASFIYRSHPRQLSLSKSEFSKIIKKYNRKHWRFLEHRKIPKVNALTFGERSLLTRDGEEYKFSHKSFYEFLMAYIFFLDWENIKSLQGMDFAVQIFDELCADYQKGHGDGLMPIQQVSEADAASALHNMGYSLQALNQFNGAEKVYSEALEIRHRLAKDNPAAYEPHVAMTLNNLAALHNNMNDYAQAAEEYAEALEIRRRLAATNPTAYEPDVAQTLNNLAILHNDMKDYDKAAKEYAKALEIRRRLAKANPAAYEPHVAGTLNNLAALHNWTNNYAQAAEEYAEALEIRRRLAATNPTAYEPDVAQTLNNLAILHNDMKDYDKAAKEYAKALEIRRRLAKANPAAYEPHVAETLGNLALLHKAQGNYSEAEGYAQECLDIFRRFAEISHEAFDGYVKKAEELLNGIREAMKNDD
ncbi:MAG: tetratricopeptide repeat protein [Bacteroidales bacterium]|nr:tetratricopeptide repeat protein [Bacteroidales bacterium]